jgi:hypothetical protein
VKPALPSISLPALLLAALAANAQGRTLTPEFLNSLDEPGQPLPMQEYAPRDDAPRENATPDTANFSGLLRLINPREAGDFEVLWDYFDRMRDHEQTIRHLPDFEFEFIQRDNDLIPLRRGVVRGDHPYWEYIIQPGRVWKEPGDGAWTRASIPFSLQERSANCTHNGMMTWLFNDRNDISRVAYQISSETCPYFKFNMWGVIPATFKPIENPSADMHVKNFRKQRAARLPLKPIEQLADSYPQIELSHLGAVSGIKPEDMTVYGFIVDGVHYRGGCETRHGPYPYCDSLALPSYSTAKSVFASVALMRLEELYPGTAATKIGSVVPECLEKQWADVTIENALDMATGNYDQTEPDADENSPLHEAFVFSDSHAEKIDFACHYFKRRAPPGTTWVYHTSDTYVAGTAMRAVFEKHEGRKGKKGDIEKDIYKFLLVEPIWDSLHLSPLLSDIKRTYDAAAQPFTGYGLTYEPDDIARLAHWLLVDDGRIDGESVLIARLFNAAMQRDPDDRGLPAASPLIRYNNGFWARDVAEFIDCDHPVWVPFMVGVGGIEVVMFPNDTIYYYFSDGYVHRWRLAAAESNKIRGFCQ